MLVFRLSSLRSVFEVLEKILSKVLHLLIFLIAPVVFILFILLLPVFWIERVTKNLLGKKPAIIYGPYPIIHLSIDPEGDRTLGYASDSLVYSTYYFTKNFTFNLENYFKNPLISPWLPYLVFLWSSVKYDIFNFYYRGGFLLKRPGYRLELPLLRLAGKGIIFRAHGSDVRQEDVTRGLGRYNAYTDYTHEEVRRKMGKTDTDVKEDVARALRYGSVCLSMGDMSEYTPGSKNDVFYWGIDLKKVPYVGVKNRKIVRIVHAPNHRKLKGTRFLEKAIDSLKKRGFPVELKIIEKVPNEDALDLYKNADVIADQFLIGWHGTFAIESMALGKPVVCYIRKKSYLPSWAKCPIVNANPDNLESKLEELVKSYELRKKLGEEGRRYVEQVFDLNLVGRRMAEIYSRIW